MIGRRERWSYAAGDLGFNFVWQSVELYLLYFYIRGIGLSPPVASGIFLAGAAVDFVADPLVGSLVDRQAARIPLRAWVALGGPASVLILVLAFSPPLLPRGAEPAFALVTFVALRLAYSLGNIPYAALTARISADRADHLALTSVRMQGAAVGGLIVGATYLILSEQGDAATFFRHGALVLAVLALPAFAATCWGVRERVRPAAATAPGGAGALARQMWVLLRGSAELRRLLATIFAAGLAVTVLDKALLFLFDELDEGRLGYWAALMPSLALLLAAPGWTWLGRRIGRPGALVAAALVKTGAVLGALFIGGVWPVLALVAVSIVAGAGMSVMFWALVPAAVADCERLGDEAGGGCAARVYALGNVSRKLAQAVAPQVIALTLALPRLDMLWAVAGTTVASLAVVLAFRPQGGGDQAAPLPAG